MRAGRAEAVVTIEEIVESFEALEPGEERYRYLIELGKGVPGLPDDEKTETNKVQGCLSQVWMKATLEEGPPVRLNLAADSDAFIVRGLLAVLLALYSGRTPAEVAAIDAQAVFGQIGLDQHLSMGRRNGLWSMVQRVRTLAGVPA